VQSRSRSWQVINTCATKEAVAAFDPAQERN
jgi:hypothetical protein